MSDYPRRRGRPPMRRDPVFVPSEQTEEGETSYAPHDTTTISPDSAAYTPEPLPAMQFIEQSEPEQAQELPTLPGDDPVWEPIDDATPRDGRRIGVRYADGVERMVLWHNGRRFVKGRWMPGGSWRSADGFDPLPAEEPTHWLRPADFGEEIDEEAA